MRTVKVIRLGQATQEITVEDGATVSDVLAIAGASAEGRSITFNGNVVTEASTVTSDGNLLLAAQTKGGK